MNLSQQLANHFREVLLGGNWTDVNPKDGLEGISWQAIPKLHSFNTIPALVYHTNYYVAAVLPVPQDSWMQAINTALIFLPFNRKKIGSFVE